MLVDLSIPVTRSADKAAAENEKLSSFGHVGTHFDVMNKEFPLEFTRRNGIVFDVHNVLGRDIESQDVNLGLVKKNMFVAFYSGFIDQAGYGTTEYFKEHPQLSDALIDELLRLRISMIGIDFAGVRRGAEHTPKDQYCADQGVFIVENLCNLDQILKGQKSAHFTANTYPIHFIGWTGLPCRVVGETEDL